MSFFRVWTMQPIKLSRIQYRLAVELAAQNAAHAELKRQIAAQTGCNEDEIGIEGATMDFDIKEYPIIDGMEWID